MNTERFFIGQRVRVQKTGDFLPSVKGMTGRVVNLDYYTIEVRMDKITPEMKRFEDGRTGILTFLPDALEILGQFNNIQAFAEGWGVFDNDITGGIEIQRLDSGPIVHNLYTSGTPVFDTDEAAKVFVKQKADAGSEYHREALRVISE